ncbi:malectin domain-containing carbohydrate-binding protein, partial [Algibacter mikhailovii]|uniref:malectin domain-containing carbohydrate-binding protein n=1 Tax=Algibacter mikhailovii TaxID=425498 RepID=UPI0016754B09
DDYDLTAEVGAQTEVTKTFTVVVTDGSLDMDFDALGSDGKDQPKLSAIEILGQAINQAPVALAGSDLTSGPAPLTISFNSIGSSDDKGITAYAWDFGDGTSVSNEASPSHIFTAAGNYTVTLTVSDVEGETHSDTIAIEVEESVSNDFALRINAGGPSLDFEGETFISDQYFEGGKSFENISATVVSLYQTERSSDEKEFNYNIPLANGTYEVTLHFAEIYWGATGGGAGGLGKRVFDVEIEGAKVLNDYDVSADVGPQTEATKTFSVVVIDGALDMYFDALGSDGKNQPTLAGIEILGQVDNIESDIVSDAADSVLSDDPETSINEIGIFPNPASNEVTLNFTYLIEIVSYEIYDLTGRLAKRVDVNKMIKTDKIFVNELTDGSYFILAIGKQGGVYQKQLVVKK